MIIPHFIIVLGTILIAVGGVLATYGWNMKTVASQRHGIIRAVTAESLDNSDVLMKRVFTEKNDNKLSTFVLFPRMQTTALDGAIASGLFCSNKDREFLTRVVGLRNALVEFNDRLSFTEHWMSQKPEEIAPLRKILRDGPMRTIILKKYKAFALLLMAKYGVKGEERFYMKLEDKPTSNTPLEKTR